MERSTVRSLIFLLIMSLAAGCTAFTTKHSRTLLLDRTTGETKECTVSISRSNKAYEAYEECIRAFEAHGYSIWSQY